MGKTGQVWMLDILHHLIIIQIKLHPGRTAVYSDRAETRTKHARQSFLGDLREAEVRRCEGLVNHPGLRCSSVAIKEGSIQVSCCRCLYHSTTLYIVYICVYCNYIYITTSRMYTNYNILHNLQSAFVWHVP